MVPLLLVSGCAGMAVIPQDLADRTNRSISFATLLQNPDDYQGQKVALGGIILNARNLKEGTQIEILELPLDRYDRPAGPMSDSQGRFLVLHPGYLETAALGKGSRITVVGDVAGKKVQMIDEVEYAYPFLKADFIHVWTDDRRYGYSYDYPYAYPYPYPNPYPYPYYYPYPYSGWYNPWYPYWYDPWGPPVYVVPDSTTPRQRRFNPNPNESPPSMKDSGKSDDGSKNSGRRIR
jgi:outer membrane lipoprotein